MQPIRRVPEPNIMLGRGDMATDAWGRQVVSAPFSDFHSLFTYDIPPSMWFMYENGVQVYTSSVITSSQGCASITTSAVKTTLLLESRDCPTYQPNRGKVFSTACWLPSKTADGVRDFGLFTPENGVFFRLKANGKLYAVLRRNAVEVLEQEIDTSVIPNFDVQKNNAYDIQFQWRSAGNYMFYICDPSTGVPKLVHTFSLLGTLTSPSTENPALPVAFKATRTTQDVTINVGCVDVSSEGGHPDALYYSSNYSLDVAVNGTDVPILITKSPLTIGGKTNTRHAASVRFNLFCTKKATFKFWGGRSAASITGATFAPFGSGSYLETDSPDKAAGAVRATSITTANFRLGVAITVEAGVETYRESPFQNFIRYSIQRGDFSVITCSSTTAAASASLEYGESI